MSGASDRPRTAVYIATSLDGYIAGPGGEIDWLEEGAGPDEGDYGFAGFIAGIDAVVMGRHSYEMLLGYADWPYGRPVYVLSSTLAEAPRAAGVLSGTPEAVLADLRALGHRSVYLDGGITVQRFLAADLVDRMILTRLPVVLGRGIPLFAEQAERLAFRHLKTEVHADRLVTSHYERRRAP